MHTYIRTQTHTHTHTLASHHSYRFMVKLNSHTHKYIDKYIHAYMHATYIIHTYFRPTNLMLHSKN